MKSNLNLFLLNLLKGNDILILRAKPELDEYGGEGTNTSVHISISL